MKFKKENIKLLLQNSFVQPSSNYEYVIDGKSFEISSWSTKDDDEVESDLTKIQFVNTQVNSIRKLFVELSPSDKDECKDYLFGILRSRGSEIAPISLNALVHMGYFNEVFKYISDTFKDQSEKRHYVSLLNMLSEILTYEWRILTWEQIDDFYRWTEDVIEGRNLLGKESRNFPHLYGSVTNKVNEIWRKLNIIKTLNLKNEIFEEFSQEITTDEASLKIEIKRNNFPDYLNQSLEKISIKISSANDNFDFKGCMDLIRAFSESLFSHISEMLDEEEGKKINGRDSEDVAKFFVKHNLISAEQGKLIIALRHFISNEGVHRLKSRPDDARLSRNMIIELGLYLLLRVRDFKK